MMDQQNFEAAQPALADPAVALAKALGQWPKALPANPEVPPANPKAPPDKNHAKSGPSVESLIREHGLKLGEQNQLTIRRIKRGQGYSFVRANGSHIRCTRTIRRLHSMAVPPAYAEVRYSPDPTSICRRWGAMPPAGCNTAITPTGKKSANTARPTAWRGWWRRSRRSAATSLRICRERHRPANLRSRR